MKVKLNDFSSGFREDISDNLKSIGMAKKLLNFDYKSGSLKGIKNISNFNFNQNDIDLSGAKVFFFKKYDFNLDRRVDKLVFFDKSLNAYYLELLDMEDGLKPLGIKFRGEPRAINYRLDGEDVIILVSSDDHMVVWDGVKNPEIVLDAPKIGSMDIHYERLFAVVSGGDGAELKFSDDLDPTNWSESLSDAGTIELVDDRGKLLKVISFNDYLYIFREYGITRLYANTAIQTNFYINHLFTSGGRILENTISLAGDHVFFMTTDGFYVFDGATTRKVLDNFFPLVQFTGSECATFFNGSYYLLCKLKNVDDECVVVEIKRDDFSVKVISGLNPAGMCLLKGDGSAKLVITSLYNSYVFTLGEEEKVLDNISLHGLYESPKIHFGRENERKVIRNIELFTKNPNGEQVELTITNEEGKKVVLTTSKERFSTNLFFDGLEFSFKLEVLDNDIEIKSLNFEIKEG